MAADDLRIPGESEWLSELARLPPDEEIVPGVTAGDMLAFHSRPPTPTGWQFEPGVHYSSSDRSLVAHVYRPTQTATVRPAVILVHGGGWQAGSPFSHIRRACMLAQQGFVAASINYRLAPAARFPAPLQDVKHAIRWIRSEATALGVDPSRIGLVGDSAGGHLALLAALTPGRWEDDRDGDLSTAVQAVAGWYPFTDLRLARDSIELRRLVEPFVGSVRQPQLVEASPVTWVNSSCPPVFTVSGEADTIVDVQAIRTFHRALDAAGVANELVVLAGAGHAFDFLPELWTASFELAVAFLERVLGQS